MVSIAERREQLDIFVDILNDHLKQSSNGEDAVVEVLIKGDHGGHWLLISKDGGGCVTVANEEAVSDCKIQSDMKTICQLADGQLKPAMAFLRRKVSYSGSYTVLKSFSGPLKSATQAWISKVGKENIGNHLSSMIPSSEAEWVSRISFILNSSDPAWVRDEASPRCQICLTRFNIIRRRHHCRVCGNVVCDYCSPHQLKGNRVCTLCFQSTVKTAVSEPVKPSQTATVGSPQEQLMKHVADIQRKPITAAIDARSMPLLESFQKMLVKVRTLENVLSQKSQGGLSHRLALAVVTYGPRVLVNIYCWHQMYVNQARVAVSMAVLIVSSRKRQTFIVSFLIAAALFLDVENSNPIQQFIGLVRKVFYTRPVFSTCAIALAAATRLAIGSFGRLMYIYSCAFGIILLYYGTHVICKRLIGFSDERMSRIYQTLDDFVAPIACNIVLHLRSVFVKFGQYLGSRSDIIPPVWSSVLAKLQDDMPHDRPSYVEQCIRESFGRKVNELFESFDYQPMASASVAQVHRAVIRPGVCFKYNSGEPIQEPIEVAVKVQHEGIEQIMRSDVVAFGRIVRFIAYLNPRFSIAVSLLTAWEKEMLKELDFNVEAQNLQTVRSNLRRAGLLTDSDCDYCDIDCIGSQILVPKPIHSLVAKKAFCMTFLKGFKITDKDQLKLFNIDQSALVKRVVHAYSNQLFVDGFFNADPHPGNLMVSVSDDGVARPILLDFGMVVTLSEDQRLGYCELLYAISGLTVAGATAAFAKVGYKNSQSDKHPERDMEFFAHLLRDTGDRQSQQKQQATFRKRRKDQRKDDLAADPQDRTGRFFASFPDSLIFLFRVLGLIRGLCTTLDTPISYLDIMGDYAKLSLVYRNLSGLKPVKMLLAPPASTIVGKKIDKLIKDRSEKTVLEGGLEEGFTVTDFLGCQVCCILNGVAVVDTSAGYLDELKPDVVTTHSVFPLLDLSRLVSNILLLQLVQQGRLRMKDKICSIWTAFSNQSMTLEDLLTYRPGLEDVVPASTSSFQKLPSVLEELENGSPPEEPFEGTASRYSVFTYGYVAAGLLQHIFKSDYTCVIHEQLAHKGFYVSGATVPDDIPIASSVNGFAPFVRSMLLGSNSIADKMPMNFDSPSKPEGEVILQQGYLLKKGNLNTSRKSRYFVLTKSQLFYFKGEKPNIRPDIQISDLNPTGSISLDAVTSVTPVQLHGFAITLSNGRVFHISGTDTTSNDEIAGWIVTLSRVLFMNETKKTSARDSTPMSKLPAGAMLDPCCVNAAAFRARIVPSFGAFASARTLSHLLNATFIGKSDLLQYVKTAKTFETTSLFGEWHWSFGFQVFEMPDTLATVIVHHAFGGSIVVMVPSMNIVIAVTVNCLTLDRSITKQIVTTLFRDLNVSQNADALFGGMF